ncbi:MAG: phosphomannomutase [Pseudoxanthomonas sp.]
MPLPAFKAYDIRGRVPDELDEDLARRIGVALADMLDAGPVVLGHDVRLTSAGLQDALSAGLRAKGREVIDIGLCGTEEVYFQTDHLKAAGGVMVTASHNPMDYNGMKLVRENARPISSDTGLFDIRDQADADKAPAGTPTTKEEHRPDKAAYIQHLLSYIKPDALKPLKVVVNAGNGGAGAIVDLLAPHLPLEFIRVFHEPDGNFPNGIPNPLLPENREATASAVKEHGADFGIAWDGDFDRCFFFDEKGQFIEGYYLVGLLAQAILAKQPGGKVVHDPRLTWNTVEMVEDAGGIPVLCKSGHAFIKEKMRAENAVYGGEMSAHHYFREFAFADSGMIPWLLIAELVSTSGRSLGDWVEDRVAKFPCSGEINFKVDDAKAAVKRVMDTYADLNPELDYTDGVSADFGQWRVNIRSSNTEPLLRLNIETRGDAALLKQKTDEISALLKG